MKNKKMTYFLGLLVVAVWGSIIYRVFNGLSRSDDDSMQTIAEQPKKEPYNDFNISKDTTRLLLNYRDPFGLVKQKDTIDLHVQKSLHRGIVPAASKPAFNWAFIQYAGYIRNPVSKKLITVVNINGKNELLSEGETKSRVRLIKNLRDSIKVSFNGKTKFIALKSGVL